LLLVALVDQLARTVKAAPRTTKPPPIPTLAPPPSAEPVKKAAGKEEAEVTLVGSGTNVVLAAMKASVGAMTGSASLIAGAGHSISDLISDGIALAATAVPEWEAVCTQGIALMLVLAGTGMIHQSWGALMALRSLRHGDASCVWGARRHRLGRGTHFDRIEGGALPHVARRRPAVRLANARRQRSPPSLRRHELGRGRLRHPSRARRFSGCGSSTRSPRESSAAWC
jgi:hypothetical protein